MGELNHEWWLGSASVYSANERAARHVTAKPMAARAGTQAGIQAMDRDEDGGGERGGKLFGLLSQ